MIYQKLKLLISSKFPSFYGLLDRYKVYIKYIISGGTASGTHLGLMFVLTAFFKVYYLASTSVAFVAAFFVSFFFQKMWTFRDLGRSRLYWQMPAYFMVGLLNLAINGAGMYVLVDFAGLHYLLSQILVSAGVAIFSFLIYRYLIFRKIPDTAV